MKCMRRRGWLLVGEALLERVPRRLKSLMHLLREYLSGLHLLPLQSIQSNQPYAICWQ